MTRIKTQLAEAARLTRLALDETKILDPEKVLPYKTKMGVNGQYARHFISNVRLAHKYTEATSEIAGKILQGKKEGGTDAA